MHACQGGLTNPMQHEMGLYRKPFESMRSGRKRFEIRLCDEKRQRIALGDTIRFALQPEGTESLAVVVLGLRRYESFEQLYQEIPLRDIDCEGWTMSELLSSTYRIYTREQELHHGALAIEIRVMSQGMG
ncbi:MAG: hypothetical protein K0R39_901 [Symbiobacteriaceae bacterium]|nr:hypothetical protein [Symbiobacteriaceae bacterium]